MSASIPFCMVELLTTWKPVGGQDVITMRPKISPIGFNTGFASKYLNRATNKHCIVTKPDRVKNKVRVGFIFPTDIMHYPNINAYALGWHSNSESCQISAKAWFDDVAKQCGIDKESMEGSYPVTIDKNPKLGIIYWVELKS